VSSNSSLSVDHSSRSKNVVDDSFNDGREWLSLDNDITISSDINDPSGIESASNKVDPVSSAENSSIDSNVVKVIGSIAGNEKSVSVLNNSLGIKWESSEGGLDGGIISLEIVKSRKGISSSEVVEFSVEEIVRSSESSWDISIDSGSRYSEVASIRIERSISPRSTSIK